MALKKTKTRRCDYCKKVYRYALATSRTCSGACRSALFRQLRKEEAQEQRIADANDLADRMAQWSSDRPDIPDLNGANGHVDPEDLPPLEEYVPETREHVQEPVRRRSWVFPSSYADDTADVQVTIRVPRQPPITPLGRGRQ